MLLCRKFDHWIASIDDAATRKLVSENGVITGGSIVSMLQGERVNDFDVYFRTKEAVKAVAEYYLDKFKTNPPARFRNNSDAKVPLDLRWDENRGCWKLHIKSAGVASENGGTYAYFEQDSDTTDQNGFLDVATVPTQENEQTVVEEKPKDEAKDLPLYRPVFLSGNSITLAGRIQIVIRFFGEPDQIHENYDFVHCTNYWTSWDRKLVLNPKALECILTKELRYIGSRYPVCSLVRVRKFVQRGWTITAGQLLKIIFNLRQFDLTKFDVLEDQLTGVDAAYFSQLLSSLEAKKEESIDGNYVAELIDRIV